jgi:hypothetical protein
MHREQLVLDQTRPQRPARRRSNRDENGLNPDKSQPFALGSFRNWLRLFWQNGGIDRAFTRRALFVCLVSTLTGPLKWYERLRYRDVIRNTPIEKPPLFIVGHWRSGTTHLHNLITQDHNWGYVPSYQVLVPEFSLVGPNTLRPIIAQAIPPTRIADAVPLAADGPQEEETAVADMSLYSLYHYWSFPTRPHQHLKRALFEDAPAKEIARWKETYLSILRRATFRMEGKPLTVKNPANTGRIGTLLDLFPDAKFIHIYRDPYVVFLSTRHLHQTMLRYCRLQEIDQAEIEANILSFYTAYMQKYLADRPLIPPGNLVEVKFEDLEADPLAEMQRIYTALNLPGFSAAESAFRAYVQSVADYTKNKYHLDDRAIAQVNQHWAFALREWGYEPRARPPA